jgi:hypothetical protein
MATADAFQERLHREGYEHLRQLPSGVWIGLRGYIYTVGLCVGLDEFGLSHRYCYENFDDALRDVQTWDGEGDPPGPWIKRKGLGEPETNPRFQNIPVVVVKAAPFGQYTCEECHRTFDKTMSDADAHAERLKTFGPHFADDLAIICDDFYVILQYRARAADGVVAIAGQPDRDGIVLDAAALRAIADGEFLFWVEERQALVYRGPLLSLGEER